MDSPIAPSGFEPLNTQSKEDNKQPSNWRWGLWAAVTVFVLAMIFLLGARSIELIAPVEDTQAEFSLSGFSLPFGSRYLLWSGDYDVSIEAEGYHPLSDTITVGDGSAQRFEFHLRPLPGVVSIRSQPEAARVIVDGEVLGNTPLDRLSLEAGEHVIELQAGRYFPLQHTVDVTGREQHQQLQFDLVPAWAEISISSVPSGATVLVDGEPRGQTPWRGEVLEGEHQLALALSAFATWETALAVIANQPQALAEVTLEPAAGLLLLDSQPSGANVTVDGEFRGQTPLELELEPGQKHNIGLSKPGYQRQTLQHQLAAGEQASDTATLKPQLGRVQFDISPAQAELVINNRLRGKGSQNLSLPTVPQRIEVRLAGYATASRQITPRQGMGQVVSIKLQTLAAAKAASIKPEIRNSLDQTLLLFDPVAAEHSDFTLGASRRESGRRANEVLHPVRLSRAFYLQTTEVSNAQFRQFQADHHSGQIEGNSLNRENQPVVAISWQQAAQFCNWLSKREGLPPFYRQTQGVVVGYNPSATGYRLPSEAEWAWAARSAGQQWNKFTWGNSFPPTEVVENYADNSSARITGRFLTGYNDGFAVAASVGSLKPNSNKLYDMGGNVAEWVHDVYTIPNANGAVSTDPLGAQKGENNVIRGASWSHSRIGELRLSYRDYGHRGRDDVGFRVARYVE